jgi:hypothetical protein
MLRALSGTSESSVTSCTRPSPWQLGHAPTGVFAENAGHHDERIARYVDVDTAEVVHPRTTHANHVVPVADQ